MRQALGTWARIGALLAALAGTGRAGAQQAGSAPGGPAPAAAPSPPAPAAASSPQSHQPPPTLDAWLASPRSAIGTYPKRLAFVQALPDLSADEAPAFLPVDAAEFNRLGYFQVADQTSSAWDMKLNQAALAGLDPLAKVVQQTHADAVVVAPAKGDWQVLRPGKGGKRTAVLSAKPPKTRGAAALVGWLIQNLGWDGVVIEQKGEYLLVGSTATILSTPQIQALAVGDSADKLLLSAAERRGAGLLSLSDAKGGYGIFDIVFLDQGVTSLPPGTKLLIEKRK